MLAFFVCKIKCENCDKKKTQMVLMGDCFFFVQMLWFRYMHILLLLTIHLYFKQTEFMKILFAVSFVPLFMPRYANVNM